MAHFSGGGDGTEVLGNAHFGEHVEDATTNDRKQPPLHPSRAYLEEPISEIPQSCSVGFGYLYGSVGGEAVKRGAPWRPAIRGFRVVAG